ncbi:excisionase family DNA-binding protein [Ammoniphilus sp. 3BR4]|uniref:excisionase family DNA-binding protein n=1 Tax=Ammoniphilus sp. 3BR4 TaxID=3158265 RepID=UPI0034661D7A
MYLTIKETAEYLELPEELIRQLVLQKRIRALYDGEQYLINKEQFNHHLDQMEKLKIQWEEEAQEPIPDDIDYKDED